MNAQEARDASEAVRQQEKEARRVAEEQREKDQDAAERQNHDASLFIARKTIAKAVDEGKREAFVNPNRYLAKTLRAEGYQIKFESGRSDMGDSAAPCMVDWTSLRISW